MTILIQKPGILTTVQDLGREGFRRFGINPSGVMDKTAARLLNILLGNKDHSAVIEAHFPAPEIVFENDCVAAVGGAEFGAELDGKYVENWRSFIAPKGSVLRFTKKITGSIDACHLIKGYQSREGFFS